MNISAAPQKSRPINQDLVKKFEGRTGTVKVAYEQPKLDRVEIGKIPEGEVAYSDKIQPGLYQYPEGYTSPPPSSQFKPNQLRSVVIEQPSTKNGKVQTEARYETFELGPVNALGQAFNSAITSSWMGMVGGAAVGLVAAATFPGVLVGAAVGGALVATASAVKSYASNAGKVRELAWVETPIVDNKLKGFGTKVWHYTQADNGQLKGSPVSSEHWVGSNQPWIEQRQVGTYLKPVVVLSGEEAPKAKIEPQVPSRHEISGRGFVDRVDHNRHDDYGY